MRKIIIIGCPGSGKSTLARTLHSLTGIPLYYLDMLNWNADRTTVSKPLFIERLTEVMKNDRWIIDGNYGSTIEHRLKECDTVIFLDYHAELCLKGVEERRGKPRPDIPWVEKSEDREFTQFIKDFTQNSRPKIIELLKKYADRDVHVFTSREQTDGFLQSIAQKKER